MGGISMITALEIFSNPQDLAFSVSTDGLGIFRGPGHRGKPLITGRVNFKSTKEAAEEVGKILKAIIPIGRKELGNPQSLAGAIFNPEGRSLDNAEVLTEEMVDKIVAKLAEHGEAYSYKLD